MDKKSLLKNKKDMPVTSMESDFIEVFSVLRKMTKDHGLSNKQLLQFLKKKLTN